MALFATITAYVVDDADDRDPGHLVAAPDPVAHRVAAREITAAELVAHHRDGLVRHRVRGREQPPAKQRDAKRLEVPGTHGLAGDVDEAIARRGDAVDLRPVSQPPRSGKRFANATDSTPGTPDRRAASASKKRNRSAPVG